MDIRIILGNSVVVRTKHVKLVAKTCGRGNLETGLGRITLVSQVRCCSINL